MNGIQWFVRQDRIVYLVFVLASERRLLEQHLVDQDAKGPPIYRSTILLVQQNLTGGQPQHNVLNGLLTSGAMNSGVPQNVLVLDPYHISSLHNP